MCGTLDTYYASRYHEIPEAAFYLCNENIPAILRDLELSRESRLLSVLGSFDIGAAASLDAGLVVNVDNNPSQISLAEYRIRSLWQGDYEAFHQVREDVKIYPDDYVVWRENFFNKDKLIDIKENLGRSIILKEDIFELPETILETGFNSLYLSNVLNYKGDSCDVLKRIEGMERIIEGLPSGSIVVSVKNSSDEDLLSRFDGLSLEKSSLEYAWPGWEISKWIHLKYRKN